MATRDDAGEGRKLRRLRGLVAVAGINASDHPWPASCSGEVADIGAPAEFVPRARRNPNDEGGPNVVAGGRGTSFAVAITAQRAALWLAHRDTAKVRSAVPPGGMVQRLFTLLSRSTSWRPPGFDTSSYGADNVNSEALLQAELSGGAAHAGTLEPPDAPLLLDSISSGGDRRRARVPCRHRLPPLRRRAFASGAGGASPRSHRRPWRPAASPWLRTRHYARRSRSGSPALEALIVR
jgi:hypothetical protein